MQIHRKYVHVHHHINRNCKWYFNSNTGGWVLIFIICRTNDFISISYSKNFIYIKQIEKSFNLSLIFGLVVLREKFKQYNLWRRGINESYHLTVVSHSFFTVVSHPLELTTTDNYVVDWDVDEFDKESDEAHDGKANGCRKCNFLVL